MLNKDYNVRDAKPSSGQYSITQTTKTQEKPQVKNSIQLRGRSNPELDREIESSRFSKKNFTSGFSDVQSNESSLKPRTQDLSYQGQRKESKGLTPQQRLQKKGEFLRKLESLNDEENVNDIKGI